MVFVVKNDKTGLCKDTIDNMTRGWTGGSKLMFKKKYVVPRDRSLIDISYNYNLHKVLYFISTQEIGNTKAGITYLSK